MSKVNEMDGEGAMTEKDELFFQSVVDAYHACHESLRDTAKAMQLSRTKVRKILITMGALESDITERALALREKGYARDEIADELGVSAATLSTYMPYGERVYNREDKTKNAIRVKNCLTRQVIAAENQVGRGVKRAEKERIRVMEEMRDGKVLKLHLELMYELEEAEREVLRKYGKVRERISRDILVPADMPLHNLHYAIQKAFGWQNSHLHHFTYEDELLENLFGGKFISWVPFCGLYFRFPSEDFDDLYWDDDYEEGYSVKSWLRSKYTGPYYYGGNSEHYLAAQLAARFFLQENRTVKVGPSFDEYRKGKKGTTSHKIEDVSMDAMKMYFAAGMDELLERIPVGQLIGLELADSEDLIELVISTAKNFDANLKELDDWLGSKDDKARWELIQKTDLPVLPLSDTLIYRYDYGDDWTVKITVVEEVEGELKDQVLETERPICVAADGLPVMDDVGGIRGYCELLKVVKGKEKNEVSAFESKEDAKDWARMMGWTGRMSKAENVL